jgi:dihydrolipoamide dehydrogenase
VANQEIRLPQLGESVTEAIITAWLVDLGDEVTEDQPIVEVSTDKVDTEIPSPFSGTVTEITAAAEETVEPRQVLAIVETEGDAQVGRDAGTVADLTAEHAVDGEGPSVDDATVAKAEVAVDEASRAAQPGEDYERTPIDGQVASGERPSVGRVDRDGHEYDVVVLGAGTGGYSTALRAAQLGLNVAMVEKAKVGGTCLHWGCIPAKAILQSAEVAEHANDAAEFGVRLRYDGIEVSAVNRHKQAVVDKMYSGLQGALGARGVETIAGVGRLTTGTRSRWKATTAPGRSPARPWSSRPAPYHASCRSPRSTVRP